MEKWNNEEVEYLKNCPGCGSDDLCKLEPPNTHNIFLTDAEEMSVTTGVSGCEHCGLTFLNPRMGQKTLFKYYTKQSRIPRSELELKSPILKHMQMQLDLIESVKPIRCVQRALEIGCAEGLFLKEMEKRAEKKIELFGVELSERYINQARLNVPNLKVFESSLENANFKGLLFDVIVLRHVFEHLSKPVECLKIIKSILAPDGILYIEVPDSQKTSPSLFRFYHHEHLNYFTTEVLKNYLGSEGLDSIVCERYEKNPEGSGFSYPVIRSISSVGTVEKTKISSGYAKYNYVENMERQTLYLRDVLLPIRTRLKELVESNKKIGIFGAGPHTIDLLDLLGDNHTFVCIFDNNPNKHGKRMRGTPIVKPDCDSLKSVDSILISSAEFETQMIDQVRSLVGSEVEIISIYKKDYVG